MNRATASAGAAMSTGPLTAPEVDRLAELEAVIRAGLETFIDVGTALSEIKEQRLYRATHRSFEAYCDEKWQLGRSHAYRLVEAAQTVRVLLQDDSKDVPVPVMRREAVTESIRVPRYTEAHDDDRAPDADVSPIGDTVLTPEREAQVRPLTALEPQEQRAAWRRAVEAAGGQPTARQVAAEVAAVGGAPGGQAGAGRDARSVHAGGALAGDCGQGIGPRGRRAGVDPRRVDRG